MFLNLAYVASTIVRCCCCMFIGVIVSMSSASAMDRAEAALRIANDLSIPHGNDPENLYGLFPTIFPGSYDGTLDVSLSRTQATVEQLVVVLVRWNGWDTVHYDTRLISTVKPFVTPEGFPYYSPDPTPRSIPYIIVALQKGLISTETLKRLRSAVTGDEIDQTCETAKKLAVNSPIVPALILDDIGIQHIKEARKTPDQLVVIPTGFSHYELIRELPNRILDLNAPNLRLYNSSSSLANGKQDYFPLGALDTQLSVGLKVNADSFSHQAESIYGNIENESTTVNAVGIWGSATSLQKNARVWGGFLVARTSEGFKKDAQVIGLEVDTINDALPGLSPNRSKVGVQVVGIGTQPLTSAVEVIGAGNAKWSNGLLFEKNAIHSNGTVLGLAETGELERGIDFSHTRFVDSAFLLNQGSRITFKNKSGAASMLYTDEINEGHFVLRAGNSGLRITSNDDSRNLAFFDTTGNIITPKSNFNQVVDDVDLLKKQIRSTTIPKTSHDSCQQSTLVEDSEYVYVCVATDTWRRARLSSW